MSVPAKISSGFLRAGVSAALPGMSPTDVSDFAFTSSIMITLFSLGALCGGRLHKMPPFRRKMPPNFGSMQQFRHKFSQKT